MEQFTLESEVKPKHCPRCQSIRPRSEFFKSKCAHDGLQVWCKICKREYDAQFRKAHPDVVRMWTTSSRSRHPGTQSEYAKVNSRGEKWKARAIVQAALRSMRRCALPSTS